MHFHFDTSFFPLSLLITDSIHFQIFNFLYSNNAQILFAQILVDTIAYDTGYTLEWFDFLEIRWTTSKLGPEMKKNKNTDRAFEK